MKQTLKKLSIFIMTMAFVSLSGVEASAQAPQKFNYQGIARDAKGNPMAQQKMSLKISVLPTSDATIAEYEEIQQVTTNEFGLYTLQIGAGTSVTGEVKSVKWETGNKYINVAIDPNGGSNYIDAGTTQLLSVPYAIYADKAGMAKTTGGDRTGTVSSNATHVVGDVNYLSKFTGLNTIGKSQLFDNGTSIGIGTTTPSVTSKIDMLTTTGNIEHIRMRNNNPSGLGKFIMYNDIDANYATFTKYGSTYPGGYAGISAQYLYANLLAFGNNNGSFLLANSGNVGIGLVKAGTTVLKFNANYNSGNVGIGGNINPIANIHFNNAATGDTLKLTNNTSGHTASDGLDILLGGTSARIVNKENDSLTLGTNNTTRLLITASGNTEINGQVKIKGGTPGAGKILTSDATGLATWQTPVAATSQWTTSGTNIYSNNSGKVGIGNTTPKAKLDVVSGFDTVALFRSTSINNVENGVLRAEYSGTNLYDHVAIYGKSIPDSNDYYGVGVKGDGGYTGAQFTGTNKLLADPNGYNAVYGALLSGISDNNATYGSFSFAGQPYGSANVLGEKTASIHYAQGGEVNTGVNTSAISTPNTTAYGIYSTVSGDGNNVAGYFESDNADSLLGVVAIKNINPYSSKAYVEGGGSKDYSLFVSNNSSDSVVGTGIYTIGNSVGLYAKSDISDLIYPFGETNYGIIGSANGTRSIGIDGSARTYPTDPNYGVGYRFGNVGSARGGQYNYGIFGYMDSPVGNDKYAGAFEGNVYITGNLSKGGGTFKIDHPQDPANKYLIHSFVESPDMMNVYNGNITTDATGNAIVKMPNYFEDLNMEYRYQLTIVDQNNFAMVRVSEKINGNLFKIKTSMPNIEVSWQVTGIRKDAWANANRVVDEVEKLGYEKGKYLHPELFDQPIEKGVHYEAIKVAMKNQMPIEPKSKLRNGTIKPNSPSEVKQKLSRKINTNKTK